MIRKGTSTFLVLSSSPSERSDVHDLTSRQSPPSSAQISRWHEKRENIPDWDRFPSPFSSYSKSDRLENINTSLILSSSCAMRSPSPLMNVMLTCGKGKHVKDETCKQRKETGRMNAQVENLRQAGGKYRPRPHLDKWRNSRQNSRPWLSSASLA